MHGTEGNRRPWVTLNLRWGFLKLLRPKASGESGNRYFRGTSTENKPSLPQIGLGLIIST